MPLLLRKFQERIAAEAGSEADIVCRLHPIGNCFRLTSTDQSDTASMQIAIAQVFQHQDLLDQCEPNIRASGMLGNDTMEEDTKWVAVYPSSL